MSVFRAVLTNRKGLNKAALHVGGQMHSIDIAPKAVGYGSSISGGELLFLALATCYCNDIYREAAAMGIQVHEVEVSVEGDFVEAGSPATNIAYSARVKADASDEQVLELMRHTDRMAEIQKTLRQGVPVAFRSC